MEDWHTTYCVKEKRKTGCTEPSGYKTTTNGSIEPSFGVPASVAE